MSTAERVGVEWSGVHELRGHRLFSRCVTKSADNHHQCSPKMNHPQWYFLVLGKNTWMKWVVSVCPTFIWEQCDLLLIFSWDLQSELRAEPFVSVDWRRRESPGKGRKGSKRKSKRNWEGKKLLWPKILLCGQRQCGCLLSFLPKSQKMTPRAG